SSGAITGPGRSACRVPVTSAAMAADAPADSSRTQAAERSRVGMLMVRWILRIGSVPAARLPGRRRPGRSLSNIPPGVDRRRPRGRHRGGPPRAPAGLRPRRRKARGCAQMRGVRACSWPRAAAARGRQGDTGSCMAPARIGMAAAFRCPGLAHRGPAGAWPGAGAWLGADCATAPYANVRPLRTRKHGRPGAGPGAPGCGARHRPRPGRTADCSGETRSRLLELMRKLGSDAALAAEYEKNPEAVLQRAGLSAEERKAMLEKDYEAIKRLTGLADGKFATNHLIRTYED